MTFTYTYKGFTVYKLCSAGVTWFEVLSNHEAHSFSTAQEAQDYINSQEVVA